MGAETLIGYLAELKARPDADTRHVVEMRVYSADGHPDSLDLGLILGKEEVRMPFYVGAKTPGKQGHTRSGVIVHAERLDERSKVPGSYPQRYIEQVAEVIVEHARAALRMGYELNLVGDHPWPASVEQCNFSGERRVPVDLEILLAIMSTKVFRDFDDSFTNIPVSDLRIVT